VHVVFQLWQWRFRLAKQKPHRRFGDGVLKILVMQSEPNRHAAQQQRVQQQIQIQIAIHQGKITNRLRPVKLFYPANSPQKASTSDIAFPAENVIFCSHGG
jgi:hypothetical protein